MAVDADATIRAMFAVRRADLATQLADVKDALVRFSGIDGALYARVAGRLEDLLSDCETALTDADQATETPDGWVRLRAAQAKVSFLAKDTIAFTEGALLRRDIAGGGFCALADKLLDRFNGLEKKLNWNGFTILGETAYLGWVGEVVRLRFPGTSTWHLPVAAHEFGHYANPMLHFKVRDGSYTGYRYPVAEYLDSQWKPTSQKPWFHAHELLADIFAVYAVGAAYAYCVLFLHTDPAALRSDTTTHPSWNDRFWVIIETLRRIELHGGVTPPVSNDVAQRWEVKLSVSAGDKQPDEERLRELVDFYYPLLDENLRGVRYSTFNQAQQSVLPLQQGEPLHEATIPDILNAAWLARLHDPGDQEAAETISQNAAEAIRGA